MDTLLHRLRGLLGLGIIGGCVGVLFGPVAMLLNSHPMFGAIFGWGLSTSVAGWGLFGALAGAGFGLVLTITAGRRRLPQLDFWGAALLGGAVGLALPVLFGPQLSWMFPSLVAVLPRTALCGVFGMLLGSGLVAVAKEADRRELPSAESTPMLGASGDG